jgi:hypothetical protein
VTKDSGAANAVDSSRKTIICCFERGRAENVLGKSATAVLQEQGLDEKA